jgi:hypothetical protein
LAVVEEESWQQVLGRDASGPGRVLERGRVGHRAFVLVEGDSGKGKEERSP